MIASRTTDLGLLLIRLMVGIVFVYHGQAKLFGGLEGFAGNLANLGVPAPQAAALLAALSEFGGGLVLIAGVAFRWALWPLIFTITVACLKAHPGKFGLQDGGMEYALTLGVVVLGLVLTGPGNLAIPALAARAKAARSGAGEGV
jgi:putative oxidoreductase